MQISEFEAIQILNKASIKSNTKVLEHILTIYLKNHFLRIQFEGDLKPATCLELVFCEVTSSEIDSSSFTLDSSLIIHINLFLSQHLKRKAFVIAMTVVGS